MGGWSIGAKILMNDHDIVHKTHMKAEIEWKGKDRLSDFSLGSSLTFRIGGEGNFEEIFGQSQHQQRAASP